jgi:hypothetical protein
MKTKHYSKIKYIEPKTVEIWLSLGYIKSTWYGGENTYYVDDFGIEFYCKNYPSQYGEITT